MTFRMRSGVLRKGTVVGLNDVLYVYRYQL